MAAFGCNSLIYSGKGTEIDEEFALTYEDLNRLLPAIRDKAQHCILSSYGILLRSTAASILYRQVMVSKHALQR